MREVEAVWAVAGGGMSNAQGESVSVGDVRGDVVKVKGAAAKRSVARVCVEY